jgi:hypothetical protein
MCRTQLLHAVGAAYALKMENNPACTVTFFGDGASSEVHPTYIFLAISENPFMQKYISSGANSEKQMRFPLPSSSTHLEIFCIPSVNS